MITVAELIKTLEAIDKDRIVIIPIHGGMSFSPLADFDEGMYVEQSTWMGDAQSDMNINEDPDDEDYDDYRENGVPSLALWGTI